MRPHLLLHCCSECARFAADAGRCERTGDTVKASQFACEMWSSDLADGRRGGGGEIVSGDASRGTAHRLESRACQSGKDVS
jgi:hypothetical protein